MSRAPVHGRTASGEPRNLIIIAMRAAGKNRAEIADALKVSVGTVRTCLTTLFAAGRCPEIGIYQPKRHFTESDMLKIIEMQADGWTRGDIARALLTHVDTLRPTMRQLSNAGRLEAVPRIRLQSAPSASAKPPVTARVARKLRRCLCGCGTEFLSRGPGNRIAQRHIAGSDQAWDI